MGAPGISALHQSIAKPARFCKGVRMPRKPTKRWIAKVKTDSTHPPEGLFTKSATTIARVLASRKVSPKGPGSGLRMLTYFINRGGRGLSAERRAELQKAKALLSKKIKRMKEMTDRRKAA
jgi:Protein of unknown function (DUF3175)